MVNLILHTFRGKFAPISGSIDANDVDALAAAVREIREETQLVAGQDLIPKFRGSPFSFSDKEAQRSWTVHPFGWTLIVDESRIKLDWEHSNWEWIKPYEIVTRKNADDCVPRLDQSFRRVYFGPGGIFGDDSTIAPGSTAGRAFLSGLERLGNDKEHGARVLATEAVRTLAEMVRAMCPFEWTALRIAAYHLIYSARPSMNAAISSAILAALEAVSDILRSSNSEVSAIIGKIEACISYRNRTSETISEHFVCHIREHCRGAGQVDILTLSSSSTIRSSILQLLEVSPKLHVNLHLLESRPLCEGASMAAGLLLTARNKSFASRLRIKIAPDSHIAQVVLGLASPSILLLGADRISPSGHVSNKTGSCAAALVVRELAPQTQVVVLSESDKIAKPSNLQLYERDEEDREREMQEHSLESNDPVEVTRIWPLAGAGDEVVQTLTQTDDPVEVQNVYFEWVSQSYIDVYISEDGPMKQDKIREISLQKARLEDEMFAGLYDD